jgi:hypothetical protein
MPEEKGLGAKLLGLFVDVEGGAAAASDASTSDDTEKSAAELVAELATKAEPRQPAPTVVAAPVPAAAPTERLGALPPARSPVTPATVDFEGVFRSAGMDAAELDRVRKAEELLKALPEQSPIEVKRQIVEASLKAFGIDLGKIAGSASSQLKALETYVKVNEQQTVKAIAEAERHIAQLDEKIIELRAEMMKRTEQLHGVIAAADLRKGQIARILEFFRAAT